MLRTIAGAGPVARTPTRKRARSAATRSAWSVEIDERGTLRQVYFDGNGCCISQAAASMLAQRLEGRHANDVKAFSRQDMLDLLGVPLGRKRQNCGLLAWRVMRIAVDSPVALSGTPD